MWVFTEYGSSIYKIPELSAKLLDKQNFQEVFTEERSKKSTQNGEKHKNLFYNRT